MSETAARRLRAASWLRERQKSRRPLTFTFSFGAGPSHVPVAAWRDLRAGPSCRRGEEVDT